MRASVPILGVPAAVALTALAFSQTTTRLSTFNGGGQIGDFSRAPAISGTGRFVAFMCPDDALAGALSNGDIYVHDRDPDGDGVFDQGNGVIEMVSVSSAGVHGNTSSDYPAISSDGRYVAFLSAATNLVVPDTNGFPDIFVRDRQLGLTERITGVGGVPQPNNFSRGIVISGDGRYVAFETTATNQFAGDSNGASDVFRFDRQTLALQLVSINSAGTGVANAASNDPQLSGDGRYVAFESGATNLVAGVGADQVYVRDMLTGTTSAVSRSSTGALGNQLSFESSISADGRFVAFASYATNFSPLDPGFSKDVYLRDLTLGTTELISVNSLGVKANGSSSSEPVVSADGSYVAFWSSANNLWWNGTSLTDVYIRDRARGQTRQASFSSGGNAGNGNSANFSGLALAGDGMSVVFASDATNLVPGDTNNRLDVFARELCDDTGFELGYGLVGSNGLMPTLEVCGELATGSQATFTLHHAPPNTLSVIFRSAVLNPVAFHGGTRAVGQPWMRTTILTDATGSASFTIPGGGGPSDLYVQWLMRDGGLPGLTGFSNALRVPVLP